MQEVAALIFEGAMAFLNRQYRTIAMFAVVAAVIIGVLIGVPGQRPGPWACRRRSPSWSARSVLASPVSSACTSPSRPTCGPRPPPSAACKDAIIVSLRGGAVSGFLVVALSLLGVLAHLLAVRRVQPGARPSRCSSGPATVPFEIVGFGFGASLRGAVRPAGRRYLHQGRRRRRRPGRQGRSRYPRGRPAQRRRHR